MCGRFSGGPTEQAPLLVLSAALLLQSAACAGEAKAPEKAEPPKGDARIVVTVLYDNNPFNDRLKTAWGFSCVVEGLPETILFDTGGEGDLLLSNMAKAGFKPEQVDPVVLCDIHGDHTGGLGAFLEKNSKVRVFLPKAFPSPFKRAARQSGANVVDTQMPCKVRDGTWTTGVLTRGIAEQALYLKTPKGIVVITGCAHPGVVNLAAAAKEHADSPVYAVLGGLHMGGASAREIRAVIRGLTGLGVQQVAPCHCSVEQTRRLMKEAFGQGYLPCGVGARLVFYGTEQNEQRERGAP